MGMSAERIVGLSHRDKLIEGGIEEAARRNRSGGEESVRVGASAWSCRTGALERVVVGRTILDVMHV